MEKRQVLPLFFGLIILILLVGCTSTPTPTLSPPTEEMSISVDATPTAVVEVSPAQELTLDAITPSELVDTKWQWISLVETLPASQSVVSNPENYVLIFREDGTLNITADCNQAIGSYELLGSQLSVMLGPTTLAECGPDSLYDLFLRFLDQAGEIGTREGDLVLVLADGAGTMSFENAGEAPAESETAEPFTIVGDPEQALGDPDFIDDFNSSANWGTFDNRCFTTEISDGKLNMTGKLAVGCWELTWPEIQDFYLEATVDTTANCPGDGYYGLIYRAPDTNTGYLFGLTCDGRYVLVTRDVNGQGAIIPLSKTEASKPGREQTNRIGVLAVGNTHTLYINGQMVEEIQDTAFRGPGRFGVAVRAGAGDVPIRVAYDMIRYWDLPEGTQLPSVEVPPRPTPIPGDPTQVLGAAKFIDTFDTDDNWTLFDVNCFTSTIEDGKYVMTGKWASYCWETTWPRVQDFYLDVLVTTTESCPSNAQFGLFFRAPDTTSGYVFGISCEGRFGMGYWDGDSGGVLNKPAVSDVINAGPNQTNRLGVLAVGSSYQLYINGELVGEVEDDTFTQEALIGLVVRAGDGRVPVTVHFDDLAYWNLP